VGTLYKQVSPFAARKVGAALVARNIARHLEAYFSEHPRSWRPLVYCWRGGKRSGSMTHVMREVGWDAKQLDGGYKSFRRGVIDDLEVRPASLRFRVVCGMTGSGKSRLLGVLARQGAQVLDLEALAAHRGSVLGGLPAEPQPSQKAFETRLWGALRALDPARPTFVESESRRIGSVHLPEAFITKLRGSPCLQLVTAPAARVALLIDEYAHFFDDPDRLSHKLEALTPLHGKETIQRWLDRVAGREWEPLVEELLVRHYDPSYLRSMTANYEGFGPAPVVPVNAFTPEAFEQAAAQTIALEAGAA
jgi:tRNA 2-selenouridine synthase